MHLPMTELLLLYSLNDLNIGSTVKKPENTERTEPWKSNPGPSCCETLKSCRNDMRDEEENVTEV